MTYEEKVKIKIKEMAADSDFREVTNNWLLKSVKYNYSFNFSWLGFPIVQYPQDIIAMQEIVWRIKPDLIIETGVYHGGSIAFYASMLELINEESQIVGIDIDIKNSVDLKLKEHKFSKRVQLICGSSISEEVFLKVKKITHGKKRILLCLDSNHTYKHVLKELKLYSDFITKEGYMVVFDTVVADLPPDTFKNYDKENNPKTAVWQFLKDSDRFVIDKDVENKLLITANHNGFLKPLY